MTVNLITYNAAITALSKAARRYSRDEGKSQDNAKSKSRDDDDTLQREDLWTRVLLLLKQMKDDGIEPDGFCYASAISCCGSEGRWEEAMELINVMKKGGPRTRPNKVAYTAAICKFFYFLKNHVATDFHLCVCCLLANRASSIVFFFL